MAEAQLRPLRVGEVLDVAIKIYLRHARTLLKLALAVELPVQLISFLIQSSTLPDRALRSQAVFSDSGTTTGTTDTGAYIAGSAIVVLLGLLAVVVVTAACLKAISEAYLGERPQWRASLAFALRRLPSLIWMQTLMWVLLLLATIALLLPAIWLGIAWSVAAPALLLEGLKGRRALGRSFRLVRGRWWPTCGTQLVGFIIASVVSGAVEAVFFAVLFTGAGDSGLAALALTTLGGLMAGVLTRPFQAAVATIIYFDLRVRKEGLDVNLLAKQLGLVDADRVLATPPPVDESLRAQAPYWPPPPGWRPPGAGATEGVEATGGVGATERPGGTGGTGGAEQGHESPLSPPVDDAPAGRPQGRWLPPSSDPDSDSSSRR